LLPAYVSLFVDHRTEKFFNRLAGKTDIEDAFERLDMLTKEETGMTAAQTLAATHVIDNNVKVVEDAVKAIKDGTQSFRKLARPILIT
jgi:hypothetical protein